MSALLWMTWLLRILAGVCITSLVAVFMPLEWISRSHEWMGLGPFPEAPIAEYLARSTSALCAFYGGFIWMLSRDPMRYLPVIKYQAWAMLGISTVSVVLWLKLGMAAHWALLDGLGGWGILLPILVLAHRLDRSSEEGAKDAGNSTNVSSRAEAQ